jgi:hypothetical protein
MRPIQNYVYTEEQNLSYCVRFKVLTVASMKMAVFWIAAPFSLVEVYHCLEVLAVSIIRAMDTAENTSETSVNLYQTTCRYNPEDSHLRSRGRENLKFHLDLSGFGQCTVLGSCENGVDEPSSSTTAGTFLAN